MNTELRTIIAHNRRERRNRWLRSTAIAAIVGAALTWLIHHGPY